MYLSSPRKPFPKAGSGGRFEGLDVEVELSRAKGMYTRGREAIHNSSFGTIIASMVSSEPQGERSDRPEGPMNRRTERRPLPPGSARDREPHTSGMEDYVNPGVPHRCKALCSCDEVTSGILTNVLSLSV